MNSDIVAMHIIFGYIFLSFQVNNIMGEYVEVQAFVPAKKTDPTCLCLEDHSFNIHASRILEYTHPMTEVDDYAGPNPKKGRIYRQMESGKTGAEPYGRISQQIPPC